MAPLAVATDTFTKPAAQRPVAPRRAARGEDAARVDDTPSGAQIVNRGERPLELSLLMTNVGSGVISVRNRDRQTQLVRVLLLRRRVAAAVDCAGRLPTALEPQRDGTIIAVEVPAGAEADIRFRLARADERLDHEDPAKQAAALVVKAAKTA